MYGWLTRKPMVYIIMYRNLFLVRVCTHLGFEMPTEALYVKLSKAKDFLNAAKGSIHTQQTNKTTQLKDISEGFPPHASQPGAQIPFWAYI